jgi:hypothetical protein
MLAAFGNETFLNDLWDFEVPRPDPSDFDDEKNAYPLEQTVPFPNPDVVALGNRIDACQLWTFRPMVASGQERYSRRPLSFRRPLIELWYERHLPLTSCNQTTRSVQTNTTRLLRWLLQGDLTLPEQRAASKTGPIRLNYPPRPVTRSRSSRLVGGRHLKKTQDGILFDLHTDDGSDRFLPWPPIHKGTASK